MWAKSPSQEARYLADGLGYFIGGLILDQVPKDAVTQQPVKVNQDLEEKWGGVPTQSSVPSQKEIETMVLQFMGKLK